VLLLLLLLSSSIDFRAFDQRLRQEQFTPVKNHHHHTLDCASFSLSTAQLSFNTALSLVCVCKVFRTTRHTLGWLSLASEVDTQKTPQRQLFLCRCDISYSDVMMGRKSLEVPSKVSNANATTSGIKTSGCDPIAAQVVMAYTA
jgi:hypothetical protein